MAGRYCEAPEETPPIVTQSGAILLRMSDRTAADAILERVRSVPEGTVVTYGDLCPGAPRRSGAVLAGCSDPTVPWHRVVRADGSLSKGDRQRRLLEQEGVPFRGGRVDMDMAWVELENV